MIVRTAAALVGLWALASMGPLGWFVLLLSLVALGLAVLVAWPLLLLGAVAWLGWRLRGRWRRRGLAT